MIVQLNQSLFSMWPWVWRVPNKRSVIGILFEVILQHLSSVRFRSSFNRTSLGRNYRCENLQKTLREDCGRWKSGCLTDASVTFDIDLSDASCCLILFCFLSFIQFPLSWLHLWKITDPLNGFSSFCFLIHLSKTIYKKNYCNHFNNEQYLLLKAFIYLFFNMQEKYSNQYSVLFFQNKSFYLLSTLSLMVYTLTVALSLTLLTGWECCFLLGEK